MKQRLLIGLLVGIILLSISLSASGVNAILSVALAAGPALLLLIPLHFVPLLLDVLGWQNLLPHKVPIRRLLWIAVVREAVERLLPAANLGGELAGIRLLLKTASSDAPSAIASVVAETVLTLVAQCLFIVVGTLCLLEVVPEVDSFTSALILLGACLLITLDIAFFWGYGPMFNSLTRAAERLFPGRAIMTGPLSHSHRIYFAIECLRSTPGRLSLTLAWQFAGLMVGTAETWLALRWFGRRVALP